jgi:hypothetical protein
VSAWLKRFGLHLAAAVGATGIFVAAAAVGASQTRQQEANVSAPVTAVRTRTPAVARKPTVVVAATPSPTSAAPVATDAGAQATPRPTVSAQTPPTAVPPEAPPTPIQNQPGTAVAKPTPRVTAAAQPVTVEAQPTASDSQPEPDQSQPAAQQPAGPPKPGGGNPPAPRPTPRGTSTAHPSPSPSAPAAQKVVPERSLAGTVKAVVGDGLDVMGVGGREWHVIPTPGALIRLNGKAAKLDGLQPGDTVVILGQAQSGPGNPFLAHAITARRK